MSTTIDQLNTLFVETDRLYIRPIKDADLKEIYAIHSDPEVNKYLPYDTWRSWDDAKHWYAKTLARQKLGEARQFVIKRMSNNDVIGTCIVFNAQANEKCIEFGYVLAQRAWKQGFMTEAMSAFIPELQKNLDLVKLNASVESDNIASLSLLEKFNFTHVNTTLEQDGVHLHRLQKTF